MGVLKGSGEGRNDEGFGILDMRSIFEGLVLGEMKWTGKRSMEK